VSFLSHMDQEDAVFKAMADPTRRALLDALRNGPATTGDLCSSHPEMSRFGVMDHLRVLREAGLITVEGAGRTRWNYLNPVPIREVYVRWMQPIAEAPAAELLAIKATAEARGKTTDVRDTPKRRVRTRTDTSSEGRSA
jgi:DNA-binding transcriptional ArsR family regulator